MAEPSKPLKKGLESIVAGLLDLDEGAPPSPKLPAPVNSRGIDPTTAPKAATKPVHGSNGNGRYRGPIVTKGSQIAPKRESSADYIDGRSDRATGRNSRLNLSLKPEYLDAFKWGARLSRRPYNTIIEDWIAEKFPQQLADILAEDDESI